MLKVTVQQAREAYRALRRVNDEVRLPAKAAWRVGRLLTKVKAVVADFEQTQLKLFLQHGGVQSGNGVTISEPLRNGESDEDWTSIMAKHMAKIAEVNAQLKVLNGEPVEIDHEPISIALFEDAKVSANDLADAGPFVAE